MVAAPTVGKRLVAVTSITIGTSKRDAEVSRVGRRLEVRHYKTADRSVKFSAARGVGQALAYETSLSC